MQIIGQVIKIKGENAVIQTKRSAACRTCASTSVCGKKDLKIISHNNIQAQVGDFVAVQFYDNAKALSVLAFIFLIPILILFIGYGLYTITPVAVLTCIPLLAVYLLIAKRLNKQFKPNSEITEILPSYCQGDKE